MGGGGGAARTLKSVRYFRSKSVLFHTLCVSKTKKPYLILEMASICMNI